MHTHSITVRVLILGSIAGIALIASSLVMGLISEREYRHTEAQADIAHTWGTPQTLTGPILRFETPSETVQGTAETIYILPDTLFIQTTIEPEIRSRGIFDTVVYTEHIHVRGVFQTKDFVQYGTRNNPEVFVTISDTRSIGKQVYLTWGDTQKAFEPGSGAEGFVSSGMHTPITLAPNTESYQFSFEVSLRGSGEALFVPLGRETTATMQANWDSPSFVGAFLPSERTLEAESFTATWNVSSFGRSYPQTWSSRNPVTHDILEASAFGVQLFEGVGLYTQVERSVKYAALFILVTFTTFFLFEVITRARLHPIQYLFIGTALALFYLLLLSFAEHVGFLTAYIIATSMITLLITLYSASVLHKKLRAALVFLILSALYSYLYFVLQTEDYALIFGSLLVFTLLAGVMFLTRNIDWHSYGTVGNKKTKQAHESYITE